MKHLTLENLPALLSLDQIKAYFPEQLHTMERFMLREYLQHNILNLIFTGPYAHRLVFIGGTCLRILHGNQRFSEDLDFDLKGLELSEFEQLANYLEKELQLQGYQVEMRPVTKAAWHCHLKFPGLLYDYGLSGYREEKILIQVDAEAQHLDYQTELALLNRFDWFTEVLAPPLPVLFSMKLRALFFRKRSKGRDLSDLLFLMGRQIQPEYTLLPEAVNTPDKLAQALKNQSAEWDLKALFRDVEPFLFQPDTHQKMFPRFPQLLLQHLKTE